MAKLSMGALEAQVMDVVWDDAEWVTPADVHAVLARQRSIAYTTVMTVLVRLWQKGRLERREAGRAYAYHATMTREEFAAARMGEILASGGDRALTLSQFLDALAPADRTRLRRQLERRSGR